MFAVVGSGSGKASNPGQQKRPPPLLLVCKQRGWRAVLELVHIQAPGQMCLARTCCRFVLGRRLYSWVWMQNCVHGVAPSRAQLVDQVGVLNAEWPPAVREATCLGRASARTQGKWLASFRRRRWQARIGVLKVQEDLPVEVMQAKVGLRLLRKGLRPRNGPKKDAAWRSRFWGRGLLLKTLKSRLCFWYLFRGRLAAPKLGTIFCGWFWGPRRWQSSNGQTQPQRLLAGHRCY